MPLLRLLGGFWNGEKEIITELQSHIALAVEATQKLPYLVSQIASENWEGARGTYLEIDRLETSADDVHKHIVEGISSGVFFSGLGVDIINLAENIDDIADSAKDAARVLIYRRLTSKELIDLMDMIQNYPQRLYQGCYSTQVRY